MDHLGALGRLFGHPGVLLRERRRRAADRTRGYAAVRGYLQRGKTLTKLAEGAMSIISRGSRYDGSGLHHAASDEAEEDFPLLAYDSVVRRVVSHPGVLLSAVLVLVTLVAERSLTGSVFTGSGTLGGRGSCPGLGRCQRPVAGVPGGLPRHGYRHRQRALPTWPLSRHWHPCSAARPGSAVDLLLLGCVPAAGLTAFYAARRVTSSAASRVWLAGTYALLPVAMGAVATGRLGTAVAFVLLPLIGITIGRMLTGLPRAARRAAWACGVLSRSRRPSCRWCG